MAHFRRAKPRARTRSRPKVGEWSWPAWWDVIFHRRLPRRRAKQAIADYLAGGGSEDLLLNPAKKPHHYFW